MLDINVFNSDIQNLFKTDRDTKDESHRISRYLDWLSSNNGKWFSPDFDTYRDYLLSDYHGRDNRPLSPTSVKSHLSTIRGRYKRLLKSNSFRDYLFDSLSTGMTPSDKKAIVDEFLHRIANAIDPVHAAVDVVTSQDIADSAHIRLTSEQVSVLMSSIKLKRLMGLRDSALIALMLCTGIRESELCALNFEDMRKSLAGELALHVRKGKGSKERLIPYGELTWGLDITLQWCSKVNIESGPVFRGFYRGGKRIRDTHITVRAINQILAKYPIEIEGKLTKLAPHDLRRTYARAAYESGMDVLGIRDNLGHSDLKTTLKYIGRMDVGKRKPQNVYNWNL